MLPVNGEAFMRNRNLVAILAFMLPVTALAATPPSGCSAPEARQFDFWAGRWDVYAKGQPDKKLANSLVENLYDGCAIRENWMPFSGAQGGSLNAYDPGTGEWRQFWASRSSALFRGNWNGKAMVLEGVWPQPGKPHQLTRMTYTPLADGGVEQLGVTSDDGGKSWQPSFDLIYRKAAP
jgi:hypothetical protein